MRDSPAPVSSAAGFSLVEMLVVLTIVSMVAGIAAVSVQRVRNGKAPTVYARDLSESMTALRYRAMNTGRIQTSEIGIDHKTFTDSASGSTIVIPSDWTLSVTIGRQSAEATSSAKITFLPDGTSSGAQITLSEPGGNAAYVRVNWLTGLSEYSDHEF